MYYDVLEQGKKPIAPSYLRAEDINSASGILRLGWDINDVTNTGAYYLYRGIDKFVECTDNYFYVKIPYGQDSLTTSYDG
jgi:hypothetical protein